MKTLFKKPSKLFWMLVPVIVLLSILNIDSTIDINIHDTYFVVSYFQIGILVAMLFGCIGLINWLSERFHRKRMLWISMTYIILIIGGVFILLLSEYAFRSYEYLSKDPYSNFNSLADKNLRFFIAILMITIGLFLLLVNCVIGILKKEH